MQRRGAAGRPGERRLVLPGGFLLVAVVFLPLAAGLLLTGCGGAHPAGPASCGTTRTAAHVPVRIEIKRGPVSCGTAMTIERAYASAVAAGKAPGNGGGGPIDVHGWKCQGFATPVVLRTGQASRCVQDGSEILAILPLPA